MLMRGRPFAMEIVNAKRSSLTDADIAVLERTVEQDSDGAVVIMDLRMVGTEEGKDLLGRMGAGAQEKQKAYAAIVWCACPVSRERLRSLLDSRGPLEVTQSTPMRVLHRRTLLERRKHVLAMRTEWINAHWFILRLITSAGAYVKEFVHGDLGRTRPSVGDLLQCEADIIQLDVLGVADAPVAAAAHLPDAMLLPLLDATGHP
jgi:tRNA pseudouridine synthase 10